MKWNREAVRPGKVAWCQPVGSVQRPAPQPQVPAACVSVLRHSLWPRPVKDRFEQVAHHPEGEVALRLRALGAQGHRSASPARRPASASSRVFPMPASPLRITTRDSPPAASPTSVRSAAISRSRSSSVAPPRRRRGLRVIASRAIGRSRSRFPFGRQKPHEPLHRPVARPSGCALPRVRRRPSAFDRQLPSRHDVSPAVHDQGDRQRDP
jgi:hypothetical protein